MYDDPTRPEAEEIEIEEGSPITKEEVKKVIKKMKVGKAPGIDDITTEHLKGLDENGLDKLTELCDLIYNTGYIPDDLKHSLFITIPKKKKAQNCCEFRTISLMSHITKIILSIIILRNKVKLDREISQSQSGFQTGLGTREGLFNIRIIIGKMLAVRRKLYACFIDYEKAFDRVFHAKLMEILLNVDIHSKDRRIIQNLYWEQTASVKTGSGMSDTFNVKRGVRQGCVLSPILFNIYTDRIFREGLCGIKLGEEVFSNLRYADDTVLIAESEEELQKLVDEVKERSLALGLRMNVKKTKTMVIRRNVEEVCKIQIKVDGKILEQVESYVYLGQIITEDGKCEVEIRRRIAIARSNFMNMKNLLTARVLHLNTRKKLIRCYILSTLLYASETWEINQLMWNKIEALEMWLWRRCLKISYTEHKSNEEVLQAVGEKRFLKKEIMKKKLQYFGHIVRKGGVQKKLLDGEVEGSRGRGRPITSWIGNITQWTGRRYNDLRSSAEDRGCWRGIISHVLEGQDTIR